MTNNNRSKPASKSKKVTRKAANGSRWRSNLNKGAKLAITSVAPDRHRRLTVEKFFVEGPGGTLIEAVKPAHKPIVSDKKFPEDPKGNCGVSPAKLASAPDCNLQSRKGDYQNGIISEFAKFAPVPPGEAKRVYVPAGCQALLFQPGLLIPRDILRLLHEKGAIPESYSFKEVACKLETPKDTADRLLKEIRRYSDETQNQILATFLRELYELRKVNEDLENQSLEYTRERADKATSCKYEFENIVAGSFKVKPV